MNTQGNGLASIRRWWVKKYNLPSSSDAFQKATLGDLLLEFYEDAWVEKRDLEAQESRAGKLEEYDRKRLQALNAALGIEDEITDDPLIDKWEREIAEGRIPDLDENL